MNYVHQLMTNIPTNGDAVTSLLSLEGVSTELVDLFGETVIMGLNCIVVKVVSIGTGCELILNVFSVVDKFWKVAEIVKISAKLLQKFQG